MDDFADEIRSMTTEELRSAMEDDLELYSNEEVLLLRQEMIIPARAGAGGEVCFS